MRFRKAGVLRAVVEAQGIGNVISYKLVILLF